MDSLAELHEFAVPADIVHREIQVLKDQMMSQFQMPPGQAKSLDLPDALFQDQAEKRVKVGLIVNEVISSASLKADSEKVEAKLEELAAPYGEPDQVIEWYRGNPEQMSNIEMSVLEDQVVDHILSAANIEEVLANYADVIVVPRLHRRRKMLTAWKAMEIPYLAKEMMKAWIHKSLMRPLAMKSPSNKNA